MTDPGSGPAPELPVAEVRRRLASEVALPSRLGYTALLLVGLANAVLAAALLLTEEGLPARTRIAFALMVIIGMSWAAFAAWVLARRRVLFAVHRVIATRLAVAFTTVFTGGALLIGLQSGAPAAALPATAVGGAMMSAALVLHIRARRRVQELMQRRRELERRLAETELEGDS